MFFDLFVFKSTLFSFFKSISLKSIHKTFDSRAAIRLSTHCYDSFQLMYIVLSHPVSVSLMFTVRVSFNSNVNKYFTMQNYTFNRQSRIKRYHTRGTCRLISYFVSQCPSYNTIFIVQEKPKIVRFVRYISNSIYTCAIIFRIQYRSTYSRHLSCLQYIFVFEHFVPSIRL